MKMELPFPFCVPVAAGIVSVFMGNPLKKREVNGAIDVRRFNSKIGDLGDVPWRCLLLGRKERNPLLSFADHRSKKRKKMIFNKAKKGKNQSTRVPSQNLFSGPVDSYVPVNDMLSAAMANSNGPVLSEPSDQVPASRVSCAVPAIFPVSS
jgi:hypothetical protein